MTTAKDKRGGQPGRKTNQQIIDDWLQGLDLPPEVAAAIRDADPRVQVLPAGAPGNFKEMRELGAQSLYTYFQTATGVAKVQAFRAIDAMAKLEADDDPAGKEPDPLIADVVAGVASLSPIRKRQILSVEQVRLREEIAAVDLALVGMDDAAASEEVLSGASG